MPFCGFNKVEINFVNQEILWKIYILHEALPKTKNMQKID